MTGTARLQSEICLTPEIKEVKSGRSRVGAVRHAYNLRYGEVMIHDNILESIGNTPLVAVNRLNPNKKVTVVGKLESRNPRGSVKERIALSMIEVAESAGRHTLTYFRSYDLVVDAKTDDSPVTIAD